MTSSRLVAFAAGAWNVLTILVFVGIAALLASGYRATRDWEQGVTTRIAHQTEESADFIVKAIGRDMRGAQTMILANRDWDAPLPADTADLDMTEQVATTFARYPYPESFFTWRGGTHGIIFFSRSTRLPSWMRSPRPTDRLSDFSSRRSAHRRARAATPLVVHCRTATIRCVRH